ncbi:MAG TPA: FAD-dependent oxidoreductase [Thermohalobaculum sp.]|nr:FAD-dependent oxidoreductase [Thermohalobaculum sp.]
MAELPSTARVVVIGGGAVGASCLYHLAMRGWTESVLIERDELTSGSTWHAAGNVPTFSASWAIMNMQRYSTELYRGLADAVDYPMNYHVTGSIRLAHSPERMQEFERVRGMGRYQGMEIEVCTPDELKARYPFLELHDLKGGLYDPYDGDIDPAQLTQALAKGARDLGARIVRFCPVRGVRRDGAEWVVETDKGEVRCEYVVNAAGFRAAQVGAMFGRRVPMAVMSHQYIVFEGVDEVREWSEQAGHKLPLLRDVDSSYYLRQEKFGFNLGPYERDCRAHWATPDDPMPDDFSFQLWPDDLERLEWYLGDAMERVPVLGRAGLSRVVNGPIPYAPDGNPLIGPMPGVPQAFEACVFTFGIAQAGGAGKVLSEWVIDGGTEWDMWSCDPRRFGSWAGHDHCVAKAKEVYGHEYAMHFPHHAWPAGRPLLTSAVHGRMADAGAVFGAFGGWERALWHAAPGDDTSEEATQTWARKGPWEPRIREECEAVRDGCGVIAIPGFTRIKVEGPGARAWLDGLTCSRLPPPGRIGLLYFPDARGRIVTEMSAMVHGPDDVGLITAAAAQLHDLEHLSRGAPDGIAFSEHSDEVECLLITGPKAREVLGPLTDADLSLPWLSVQLDCHVAGEPAALIRVSFAGELGWEIHCGRDGAPAIWDAVMGAGARPFGMFALNSLRIEKAYRAWKGDLSTDYTVLQGGLERFVRWDKADFTGKAAMEREKGQGVARRFAAMTVEAGACDAPYMSTLWRDGEVVGETTSGAWGYRVGRSVALGVVRADCARPGTALEVEIYGERYPVEVQGDGPLWDPANERLRA